MIRRAICLTALAAAMCLSPLTVWSLGKPDWAREYVDLPSPSGDYMAVSDQWVIVHGDIELTAGASGGIREHYRLLLENRTDHQLSFSASLVYDASMVELLDPVLHVQRAHLWHAIDLKRSALEGTAKEAQKLLIVGAEDIPAHHRVAWEYTLADRFAFPPWHRLAIPQEYPAAKLTYRLGAGAAEAGLTLRVVPPEGTALPPSFTRGADGSWTVAEVPAASRLDDDLTLQPSPFVLYPYVLAVASKDPASTWQGFADKYRQEWDARQAQADRAAISQRAAKLTLGLSGTYAKVARLARFVQTDVLYDDSNEKGPDAWLPLTPRDTLRSMKADCKGKVMLLQSLLAAIGVESSPVILFGSDRYAGWGPTPGESPINHVILAVKMDGGGVLPATLLEEPGKGWVLFDPTVDAASFGAPIPGFEGAPALFAYAREGARFTIRTSVGSADRSVVTLVVRPDTGAGVAYSLWASDNGGSRLMYDEAHSYDPRDRNLQLVRELEAAVRQPVLRRVGTEPPPPDKPGARTMTLEFVSTQAVEEMSRTVLLANPLAAAAVVKGLPDGFPLPKAVPDADKAVLHPPWNARAAGWSRAMVLDVDLTLALPPQTRWTPPPDRDEKRPWLNFTCAWSKDGDGTWKARVHLAIPRGEWPSDRRKECLRDLDRAFSAFYEPLLLTRIETR